MGTAVGNKLYARGGWIASGSCSVGFIALALCICFVRGPWNEGWVGWKGGWSVRRRDLGPQKGAQEPAIHQVLDDLAAGQEGGQQGITGGSEKLDGTEHRVEKKDKEIG